MLALRNFDRHDAGDGINGGDQAIRVGRSGREALKMHHTIDNFHFDLARIGQAALEDIADIPFDCFLGTEEDLQQVTWLTMPTRAPAWSSTGSEGLWRGALDEVAIPLVALAGIAWYWRSRYSRSLMPAAIIAAAIAFKAVAVFIEDKDDVGDDFGAAIVYGLSLITWAVISYRTRTSASAEAGLPAHSTPEKQPAVVR
jgi:hypothetical protein